MTTAPSELLSELLVALQGYMWQCQSQYINSCTQAGWHNPDLWLRPATHGIGNAPIFADMLLPSVRIQWGSFSFWMCQSNILLPEAEERLRTSLWLWLLCVTSAELSSSGKRDRESKDSPPIVLSSTTNTPLTSNPNLWLLCVCVLLCAPRGL